VGSSLKLTQKFISVKTADKGAFNEDIMNALVEVGTKNKEIKEKYGRIKKAHLIKDIKAFLNI
jgi:hypothetical protein